MASSIDILTPSVVRKIISRIRVPGSVLSRHFGMQIDGPNIQQVPGRTYTYDLFDNVRRPARGKLPGASANAIAAAPVGTNTVTLARSAEKLPLDYNKIHNIRTLGANAGTLDRMGVRYVEKQALALRQRSDTFREFIIGSLFRGGIYYFIAQGDDLIPSWTSSGTLFGVDMKIPSSNKLIGDTFAAGLQMETGSNLITATWADAATDIPSQLVAISAAFQGQVGAPLDRVYVDHKTWLNVLQNTYVRQLAGTTGSPFATYEMIKETTEDGTPTGMFMGSIKGLPWIKWFIYDGQIEVGLDNTLTRVLPDGYATFMIDPTMGDWLAGIEGSEIVKDNDLATAVERQGFYAWIMEKADPAVFIMHQLQNFGIELNVPKGIAVARVRNS